MAYNISKLSRDTGISRQHIYAIKAKKTNASILVLQKLAKALNCNVLQVVEELNKKEE